MFGKRKIKNDDENDRPAVCRYCENASVLRSEDEMLCRLRGVVDAGYVCRKFRYDPLKRIPMPRRELSGLDYVDIDSGDDKKS